MARRCERRGLLWRFSRLPAFGRHRQCIGCPCRRVVTRLVRSVTTLIDRSVTTLIDGELSSPPALRPTERDSDPAPDSLDRFPRSLPPIRFGFWPSQTSRRCTKCGRGLSARPTVSAAVMDYAEGNGRRSVFQAVPLLCFLVHSDGANLLGIRLASVCYSACLSKVDFCCFALLGAVRWNHTAAVTEVRPRQSAQVR